VSLSKRECEVADMICEGLTNKVIAEKLFIEIGTVKFHVANIFKKLGVKSRGEIKAMMQSKVEANGNSDL
jgi:DNA-binding NarL/FixJ family response regulator